MPYERYNIVDDDSVLTTKGSVLVVDDDDITLGILKDLLTIERFLRVYSQGGGMKA